jgi:hypothetical protein
MPNNVLSINADNFGSYLYSLWDILISNLIDLRILITPLDNPWNT